MQVFIFKDQEEGVSHNPTLDGALQSQNESDVLSLLLAIVVEVEKGMSAHRLSKQLETGKIGVDVIDSDQALLEVAVRSENGLLGLFEDLDFGLDILLDVLTFGV